jgi:hypothetical protein
LNRRVSLQFLSIAVVLSLALFGGGLFSPFAAAPLAPVAVAEAAPIDPALRAAFAASADGQARFVVMFTDWATTWTRTAMWISSTSRPWPVGGAGWRSDR